MNTFLFPLFALTVLPLNFTVPAQQTASSLQEPTSGRKVESLDPRIWCLHQAANGDYWFGSNGAGMFRYDGEQLTQYTTEHGLAGNAVRHVQEDREGGILVAGGGLARFDGKRFAPLEIVNLPAGEGWILNPDDTWIVADPGFDGPVRYDGETAYQLTLPTSPAEEMWRERNPAAFFSPLHVYSSFVDRRGHLWFGTAGVGLCRYDGKGFAWMYEEHLTTTPRGGAFGIRSIFEDQAGDFWICNTRKRFRVSPQSYLQDGIPLLRTEAKVGLPAAASDAGADFQFYPSMVEDKQGVLWMACSTDGVWSFDGKTVGRYPVGDEAYVVRILFDRDGKLWASTLEQGVFTLEEKEFSPFQPFAQDR